ncbi:hypothetical protein F0562_023653 [Nyssa sinensis]|uniref:WEB family protein n=1 Tax=Nyssa sinensis TaxID=561372 RepID=A0A5J5BMZ3_9ASTE|nr:hypothetical protein F0562_023653 [Nyssa sinensis]
MGEIDTKSIESVQAALSFFGEKSDQRKNRSIGSYEMEKEMELEGLLKDLANHKVQLEAKDSAYKQALLKLDYYQKTADELFSLLKNSELERDVYINECKEARMRINELESKMEEIANQLSETINIREKLSHVISELEATQGKLVSMEMDLAAAIESKLEAMTQTEMMETELYMEKEKTEELLRHVSELNEAIFHLNLAAIEAEKEKCKVLSEKEAEIQLATATALEAEGELEHMRKQLEVMQNLENQLMAKSVFIDLLQLELQQANELHSSSEKAVFEVTDELNQKKLDLEMQERKNSDQASYIELLEMELNQLKLELKNANEEVCRPNSDVEMMTDELEKVKNEMEEIKGRDTEAQVEIAMLKSELHKGRSKIAAAEAAEARAKSKNSGFYVAVQQLALEAEEAKKETRRLKEAAEKTAEEGEKFALVNPQIENSSYGEEPPQMDETVTGDEKGRDDIDAHITISVEEYEALVKKAEKADQVPEPVPENRYELEILQKELEIAAVKIGEFRTRAEQAASRAVVAERAKAELEDKIRWRREHRERRKAALAALREESFPKDSSSFKYEEVPKTYQPLGKVLNMEF